MDRALTDRETPLPAQATGGARVLRPGSRIDGEPEVVLLPQGMRLSGPGRKERAYQDRITSLEQDLTAQATAQDQADRELEVAQLLERGTGRLADRLETEVGRQRDELAEVRAQGHRLMVALGALQRENQGLRGKLEEARTMAASLSAPPSAPRRSLLARLLGR